MWETNDIFLGTSNYCLLHQFIRWWFDCFSWLDLSRSMLTHFHLIYLFFSWYLIHLAYIDLHSYRFTFYVQYFRHIILVHPISSLILFLSSLSSLIYSSWILSSSPIYSYWMSLGPWFYETHCTYCILHMRVWILIIGYLSFVFFHFFHCITLAYVTSWVLVEGCFFRWLLHKGVPFSVDDGFCYLAVP